MSKFKPLSTIVLTIPNRPFLAVIRLYGAEIEFFDQSWKPDDLVKIN
jgi:hypothetical protein